MLYLSTTINLAIGPKSNTPGSSGVLKGGMIQLYGRRKALPDSEWHFHTQLPDWPEAEDKLSKAP
jgi:hypothetical protein